ncbi:DedA family protein [Zooshikella harenae]|uniref:DedA family protein n=1 Tax=Zooshikella harenae TaxID=2827238 RepID=A0ABS5ZFC5_9GAMM|nr:DedA family protein [Zooshikella harenae]MBU2712751.1 DedA family protein [Zooshikella harenae]
MDLSSVQPVLNWLNEHPQWIGISILLVAFIESLAIVGIIVPGVVLLFGIAVLAGTGVLSLTETFIWAGAGAILGDGISYYLGRHYHQTIKRIWPFSKYPAWFENGERFFKQHGGKSIAIGRFVGPIRPVIPMVAGMLDMPASRFFAINCCSAIAWAPVYTLPGYLVGASTQLAIDIPSGLLWGVVGLFCSIAILTWLLNWLCQRYLPTLSRYRLLAERYSDRRWWRTLQSQRPHVHYAFPINPCWLLLLSLTSWLLLFIVLPDSIWTTANQWTNIVLTPLEHPLLKPIFTAVGLLSEWQHISIISLLTVGWMWHQHYRGHAIVLLVSVSAVSIWPLLNHGMQLSLSQDHVTEIISHHTLLSSLLYTQIAALIAYERPVKQQWWILYIGLLPSLLAALSLTTLNVISFSAAISGFLLGLVLCCLCRVAISPLDRNPIHSTSSLFILLGLLLVVGGLYIHIQLNTVI